MNKNEINFRLNEPYDPKDGEFHIMDSVSGYNIPEFFNEVVLLEFRNDLCSDSNWRNKIAKIISPIIKELNEKI